MSKEIHFTKRTKFLGRNGEGKSIGLNLCNPTGDVINIMPINTKGNVARCIIEVPQSSIPELIDTLHTFVEGAYNSIPQKKETQYYVFGHQMSRTIDSEGFEAALKIARKSDFALVKYEPSIQSGADLLAASDGWDGYAEITEEQYNAFKKNK